MQASRSKAGARLTQLADEQEADAKQSKQMAAGRGRVSDNGPDDGRDDGDGSVGQSGPEVSHGESSPPLLPYKFLSHSLFPA